MQFAYMCTGLLVNVFLATIDVERRWGWGLGGILVVNAHRLIYSLLGSINTAGSIVNIEVPLQVSKSYTRESIQL